MEDTIMQEIKKQIEFILHNYTTMKSEVQVLEFELNRSTTSLRSETIESTILSHSNQERVSGSHLCDKTANIVIEHVDSQINGEYHALRTLISNMCVEMHRLEHYLSLLPEKEAEVIRLFYFEGLTWTQISKSTLCAPRTMQRNKEKGIEKLVRYYTILDRLDAKSLDIRTKVRFIGYIHEERFMHCMKLTEKSKAHGVEPMLYILSGCNELWQVGVETFYSFESGTTISYADSKTALSDNGRKLLRLAYHLANSFDRDNIVYILRDYFPGLEYVHLELAIEAIKLALFPGIIDES